MRVKSELWVSALIRRALSQGAFATVLHKGAADAGAIFIVVNNLEGQNTLYGPAPQLFYDADAPADRQFECLIDAEEEALITQKIERERSFDSDIWVVEIEDRKARSFLDGQEISNP